MASSHGHRGVVDILLKAGACIDSLDSHLRTPLLGAARSGHLETVQLLIEAGAEITPQLLPASVVSKNKDLVKFLLQGWTSVLFQDLYLIIEALELAMQRGYVDILQLILIAMDMMERAPDSHFWCHSSQIMETAFNSRYFGVYRLIRIHAAKHASDASSCCSKNSPQPNPLWSGLFTDGFNLEELDLSSPPIRPKLFDTGLSDLIKHRGVGSIECLPKMTKVVKHKTKSIVGKLVQHASSLP